MEKTWFLLVHWVGKKLKRMKKSRSSRPKVFCKIGQILEKFWQRFLLRSAEKLKHFTFFYGHIDQLCKNNRTKFKLTFNSPGVERNTSKF